MSNNYKAQLKAPKTTRRVAFSEHGWNTLQATKKHFEIILDRELSDSVTIDILLTKDHSKYIPRTKITN